MRCELESRVEHGNMREQFRETFIHCPLMERRETGMSSLGVVCGGCCLRIQQLLEAKADILLRSVVSVEDYERHPDAIAEHLPEHLQQYLLALRRLGKTMNDVAAECKRCNPDPIGERHPRAEAQAMNHCGVTDLR